MHTLTQASETLARGSFHPGACVWGVEVLSCTPSRLRFFSCSNTYCSFTHLYDKINLETRTFGSSPCIVLNHTWLDRWSTSLYNWKTLSKTSSQGQQHRMCKDSMNDQPCAVPSHGSCCSACWGSADSSKCWWEHLLVVWRELRKILPCLSWKFKGWRQDPIFPRKASRRLPALPCPQADLQFQKSMQPRRYKLGIKP